MVEPANPSARTKPRHRRPVPPGLLKRKDAAAFCSHGPATWDRNCAAGLTPPPIRIAGGVFWGRRELREWIDRGCPDRAAWAAIWATLLAAGTARRGR